MFHQAASCPRLPKIEGAVVEAENNYKRLSNSIVTYECFDGFRLPKSVIKKKYQEDPTKLNSHLWKRQTVVCKTNQTSALLEWHVLAEVSKCEPKQCLTPEEEFKKAKESQELLTKTTYPVHSVVNYTCIDGRKLAAICNHKEEEYDTTFWVFPFNKCPGIHRLHSIR